MQRYVDNVKPSMLFERRRNLACNIIATVDGKHAEGAKSTINVTMATDLPL